MAKQRHRATFPHQSVKAGHALTICAIKTPTGYRCELVGQVPDDIMRPVWNDICRAGAHKKPDSARWGEAAKLANDAALSDAEFRDRVRELAEYA